MVSSFYGQARKGYNINGDFKSRYTGLDIATGLDLYNPGSAEVIAAYGSTEAAIARLNEINAGATIYNPAIVNKMSLTSNFVEDASFLRLQNVTLGYTTAKEIGQQGASQQCTLLLHRLQSAHNHRLLRF